MIRGLIVCVLVVGLHGCKTRQAAVGSFQEGRYELAYVQAKRQAEHARGKRQTQGRLLAGLSAEALGLDEEGTGWLEPLIHQSDRNIAGRARVALAKIEHRRGNAERANSLLLSAIEMLDEEAAEQARQMGQAMERVPNAVHATVESPGVYTVQLGAFSTYRNASVEAQRARRDAMRCEFGEPRVVSITDSRGRALYLVHVGRFVLKADAQRGLRYMGNGGIIAPYRE